MANEFNFDEIETEMQSQGIFGKTKSGSNLIVTTIKDGTSDLASNALIETQSEGIVGKITKTKNAVKDAVETVVDAADTASNALIENESSTENESESV